MDIIFYDNDVLRCVLQRNKWTSYFHSLSNVNKERGISNHIRAIFDILMKVIILHSSYSTLHIFNNYYFHSGNKNLALSPLGSSLLSLLFHVMKPVQNNLMRCISSTAITAAAATLGGVLVPLQGSSWRGSLILTQINTDFESNMIFKLVTATLKINGANIYIIFQLT